MRCRKSFVFSWVAVGALLASSSAALADTGRAGERSAVQELGGPAQSLTVSGEVSSPAGFGIEAVSTRPDNVTDDDVLVRVSVPEGTSLDDVRVAADGRDVSGAFAPDPDHGHSLLGLVDGLEVGDNDLELLLDVGSQPPSVEAELVVTNHPITGPVFSGPHQTPFICQTEAFGLGPALDEQCRADTQVEYRYRTTGGSYEPFDPAAAEPDDLVQTTNTEGETVDHIVRLETGTINRAVYQIAFLHEPGTPLPDPWTDTTGYNDRLVYTFGGGCNAAYRQGASTGGVLNASLLGSGFAVASASLNVFGNNCNDVTSAETMMMVKEHFIESFGPVAHTIGSGCSGGSMQVQLIGQNYPGLLDGIVPTCTYPDITTIITPVIDCSLLARGFEAGTYTLEQRSAVTGFANNGDIETCTLWEATTFSPGWIVPSPCPGVIPESLVYDADTNVDGARCTIHDNTINVYGEDPETGFARRPVDNVGVQYGLQAFEDGTIDFDQFIELNELAGGYDVDGNIVEERTVADPDALRIAYQTGRVNSGAGGLADIPIMDVRGYTDDVVDIHDRFRSLSLRERLIATNGHADNHVVWTAGPEEGIAGGQYNIMAILLIDGWIRAIGEDDAAGSDAEKVVRNKPADAVDSCWTSDGERIIEPATFDGDGACNDLYPNHADPRVVAGAPLANDVLKCQLTPVDGSDYSEYLTGDQVDRLRATFPDGVCDYDQPGIGQQPLQDTWLRYGDASEGPDDPVTLACPEGTGSGFPDVPAESVHADTVRCGDELGLFRGKTSGQFDPRGSLTRGQAAAVLDRLATALGRPIDGERRTFSDVGGPYVHRDAIERLAGAGVIAGFEDGRFRPQDAVGRDQLASLVVRFVETSTETELELGEAFSDVPPESVHADNLRKARGAGIVLGDDQGRAHPRDDIRRDQAASLFVRSLPLLPVTE